MMGMLHVQGREHTAPQWTVKSMAWKVSYLLYSVLLLICIVDTLAPQQQTENVQTVPLKTVWFIVQFWSLCLVVHLCRTRCSGVVDRALSWFATGAPPGHRLVRAKVTNSGRGDWFQYVTCEMQGWRPQMEDAMVCAPSLGDVPSTPAVFAVFDGHGGKEVSARVAEQFTSRVGPCLASAETPEDALRLTLLELESDLRRSNTHGRWDLMGCTAAVAMLFRTSVTVASIGDSRVFKCRDGMCVPLTRDHKPESPRERKRIEAAGGSVAKFGPCYRVDFCLNMSRAMGDFQFKDPGLPPDMQKISPMPDVSTVTIDERDEFLVIACDGLFELMTWDTVCGYIKQRIGNMPLQQIAEGLLDACCSQNMLATAGRGTDNESVIIVVLPGCKVDPSPASSSSTERLLMYATA